MRPASLRDALALSTCRSLFPIAVVISFAVTIGFARITSKTALSVTDNAFAPTTLPTPLPTLPTSFPTFVPLAGQLTWSLGLFPWPLLGGSMLSRTKTMYKSIHHVIAALGVAPEDPRLEVVVEDNLRTHPLRQEVELLWGG